jgi:peptidoglycan/LPS O-acetylase OafA/YrhL
LRANIGRNLLVNALYRVLDVGWLGVDIFFVLSGFLITSIILKDRSRQDFWVRFYARRGFRILPAFAVVFSASLLAARFLVRDIPIPPGYVPAALLFMANWTVIPNAEMPMLGHLWSLAVEEQFYFIWPQVSKRCKTVTMKSPQPV